jgi:hypothetical protein
MGVEGNGVANVNRVHVLLLFILVTSGSGLT